ncbi:hypothetical protein [Solibacillus sp. NPDC093137]
MFVLTVSPFALLKHQLTAMPFPTSKASCGNSEIYFATKAKRQEH